MKGKGLMWFVRQSHKVDEKAEKLTDKEKIERIINAPLVVTPKNLVLRVGSLEHYDLIQKLLKEMGI